MRWPVTILDTIGNTPIVPLREVVPPGAAEVWVKLEWFNPTGSYKDRMALAMIAEAERRGDLEPPMTVVEYTGGSTGSSLAFVCAVKGYKFVAVSSDAFSPAKLATMRAFGADVIVVPSVDGQITPDLVPRMIEKAAEIASSTESYATDQFNNADSLVGYRQIGTELDDQVADLDVFCGAVGTAGMLMGVASTLDEVEIVAVEPSSAPVLSGGEPGTHHVEGIGVGFVPPLFSKDVMSRTLTIDEARARQMAGELAAREGVFAGTSSAMNVCAAIDLAVELGTGHRVATVAVDTGLKYLDGGLFQ